jgi:hypothetical protein
MNLGCDSLNNCRFLALGVGRRGDLLLGHRLLHPAALRPFLDGHESTHEEFTHSQAPAVFYQSNEPEERPYTR